MTENPYWHSTRMRPDETDYDDEGTNFVLTRRYLVPKDIPLDESELYPRIPVDLSIFEVKHRDWWHNQGLEETCVVWAVVNAMRAINVEPDQQYIKELLNHAITIVDSKQQRISFERTHEMAQGRELAAKLTLLDHPQTLTHLPRSTDTESEKKIVQRNANFIRKYVTRDSSLVISKPGPKSSHAICIAGYRITLDRNMTDRYMDVQIIDSATGVRYSGVEALSRQLPIKPRKSLVISK